MTNNQFNELRTMRKPAKSVLVVMEALGILLEDLSSKRSKKSWSWVEGQAMLKNPRKSPFAIGRCS